MPVVPVEMGDSTERLGVQLITGICPVESLCHKMSVLAFFVHSALRHFDTAIEGHFMVCVLYTAYSQWIALGFAPPADVPTLMISSKDSSPLANPADIFQWHHKRCHIQTYGRKLRQELEDGIFILSIPHNGGDIMPP